MRAPRNGGKQGWTGIDLGHQWCTKISNTIKLQHPHEKHPTPCGTTPPTQKPPDCCDPAGNRTSQVLLPPAPWVGQPTFSPGPGEGEAAPDALGLRLGRLALPGLGLQLQGFAAAAAAALQRPDVLGQPFVEPRPRPLPHLPKTQTGQFKLGF